MNIKNLRAAPNIWCEKIGTDAVICCVNKRYLYLYNRNKTIAIKDNVSGNVFLDEYLFCQKFNDRCRNKFLLENFKTTMAKIKDGMYELHNLNPSIY